MKDEEETLQDSSTPLIAYAQPECVKGQMRDYQIEALNWMLRLHHGNLNGILADEMGEYCNTARLRSALHQLCYSYNRLTNF